MYRAVQASIIRLPIPSSADLGTEASISIRSRIHYVIFQHGTKDRQAPDLLEFLTPWTVGIAA